MRTGTATFIENFMEKKKLKMKGPRVPRNAIAVRYHYTKAQIGEPEGVKRRKKERGPFP